jgi:hypothetical protein
VERDLRERSIPLRYRVGDLFGLATFPDDDLHPRMNEPSPGILPSSLERTEIAVGDDWRIVPLSPTREGPRRPPRCPGVGS